MQFEDTSDLHGRAPWFLRGFHAAGGPATWAAYVADGYLLGDLLLRALNSFEWRLRVVLSDADIVRVRRSVLRGHPFHLGTSFLQRNALSKAFRLKLELLSDGTLTPLELSSALCYLRTVAKSAFGPSFRDVPLTLKDVAVLSMSRSTRGSIKRGSFRTRIAPSRRPA